MSMRADRRRPVMPRVALYAALALLGVACSDAERPSVAAATDTIVAGALESSEAREGHADTSTTAYRDSASLQADPFAVFGIRTPTVAEAMTIKSYSVRVWNGRVDPLVLHADAGAGSVVVDTVAAGDSVHVNLESRADSILLRAVNPSGMVVDSQWIGGSAGVDRAVFR